MRCQFARGCQPNGKGRLKGSVFGDLHWTGTDPKLENSSGEGSLRIRNGRIDEVPLLEKLAELAQRKSFEHLELNECSLGFGWKYPKIDIKNISIEERGKFRIVALRPCSRHMISPERDPVLKRSRRECIRRTEQMNVVRHDHIATDTPEVRCLPCGDESSRRLLVCEQRLSPVSTYREEDNDRSEANFDGRKMGRFLSLRAHEGRLLEGRAPASPRNPRRRRVPLSTRIWLHPSGLLLPASSMRMRLSMYGKRIVSVRPSPSLLSTESSPPCSRTMRRTINNPRPVPVDFVVK
jgi:hypothetical protein